MPDGIATTTEGAPPEPPPSAVTSVAQAWQRVQEHKVIQWAVAYFAAALALAHAYEIGAHTYHWPATVGQVLVAVLALGFFVTVVLAWYQGHRGLTSFSKAEMSILAGLLLIGAAMLYIVAAPEEAAHGAGASEVPALAPGTAAGKLSLAVLPLVNLSADQDQEFFSDGMTEEITSALVKVPGLNVVARTSAFQFKGENRDMRAIGKALGASHLIEGSVRRAGEQVRITAQLIRAADGTHLWSESYDRELKDVFAVQEEIAGAIAGALRIPLGLDPGRTLAVSRMKDTANYELYLKAKALAQGNPGIEPGGPRTEAVRLLERVVEKEPDYAPAWGMLARTYVGMSLFVPEFYTGDTAGLRRRDGEWIRQAKQAVQQAQRIEPQGADALLALAGIARRSGKLVEADRLYARVLESDPANPDAINGRSVILAGSGRLAEAMPARRRLQAEEALNPPTNRTTATILWALGKDDEALAIHRAQPPGPFAGAFPAEIHASVGRYQESVQALRGLDAEVFGPDRIAEAAALLSGTSRPTAPDRPTPLSRSRLGFAYLRAGAAERGLDFYEHLADAGVLPGSIYPIHFWADTYAPIRKTERFKALIRRIGIVGYWRARGWPEACRPTSGDDFTCS